MINTERDRILGLKDFVTRHCGDLSIDWFFDDKIPRIYDKLSACVGLAPTAQQQKLMDIFQKEGQSKGFYFLFFVRVGATVLNNLY